MQHLNNDCKMVMLSCKVSTWTLLARQNSFFIYKKSGIYWMQILMWIALFFEKDRVPSLFFYTVLLLKARLLSSNVLATGQHSSTMIASLWSQWCDLSLVCLACCSWCFFVALRICVLLFFTLMYFTKNSWFTPAWSRRGCHLFT